MYSEVARALGMFCASMYLASVVSGIKMFWFYYHAHHLHPVADLVLDHLPYLGRVAWVDTAMLVFNVYVLAVFLVRAHARPAMARVLRALAWVHLLRALAVSVTHVPDVNWVLPSKISVAYIFTPFNLDQVHKYGDMMFSGHTASTVILFLAYFDCARRKGGELGRGRWIGRIETAVLAIWASACIVLVLVCRYHYTNDVVIGAYMGVFVWYWHRDSFPPFPLIDK